MDKRIAIVNVMYNLIKRARIESTNKKITDCFNNVIRKICIHKYDDELYDEDQWNNLNAYIEKILVDVYSIFHKVEINCSSYKIYLLHSSNGSDNKENEFNSFVKQCGQNRLVNFYVSFLKTIEAFVFKEAMNKDPVNKIVDINIKQGEVKYSIGLRIENMISLIKVLTPEKAILMLADTKELYDVLKEYGTPCDLINHIFEFKTIINIFDMQIKNSDSKDINSLIEKYKFIYQYASKDDRIEILEIARNNLANKIMQRYEVWGLDKKEIVKAFLDSSELKNLEDLENMEIRKCENNTGYVISNKNKTFIRLVGLNDNEKVYDIPKALVPVVRVFINRGSSKIPVCNAGRMKMLPINVNPEENYFGRSFSDQTEKPCML